MSLQDPPAMGSTEGKEAGGSRREAKISPPPAAGKVVEKPMKALKMDGSSSLPGSYLPNAVVRIGPHSIMLVGTNQDTWKVMSQWMGFSKQPMGLIAIFWLSEAGVYTLTSHITSEEPCTALEYDERTAATYVGQQDGMVEVYRLDTGNVLTRDWGFSAHSLDVTCLKLVGEDRDMLITCALDKQLRVFDVSKRAFIASLEVGGAGIACLLTEAAYFMPSADVLVGSLDGNVYCITLKSECGTQYSPKVVRTLPAVHAGSVQCMCTTKGGQRWGAEEAAERDGGGDVRLFTGSFDMSVGHWLRSKEGTPGAGREGGTGDDIGVECAGKICGHSATVRSVLWMGDEGGGGELLTGGADGQICQYRLKTYGYRPAAVTKAHAYSVMHMVWDGSRLVTLSDDSTVKTWTFKDLEPAVPKAYV